MIFLSGNVEVSNAYKPKGKLKKEQSFTKGKDCWGKPDTTWPS